MRIAIIGGGAAGFFAAIAAAEKFPGADVTIFEKSRMTLAKVKISGGGRCNLTNACDSLQEFSAAYPRGGKVMRNMLKEFGNRHTMEWFESRGVSLVIQEDGCVFPASQDSQSIIDCFYRECRQLGIKIKTEKEVDEIVSNDDGSLTVLFKNRVSPGKEFDRVIVTTGGSPKRRGLEWLEKLGHKIENPIPSLYSFNMPGENITSLMGIVAENTSVTIHGANISAKGALLVTHWGVSGPALLKLSSFGARIINEMGYNFILNINWVGLSNQDVIKDELRSIVKTHPGKQLNTIRPFDLPSRLWNHLVLKCEFPPDIRWADIGNKGINKLITAITSDSYRVNGKSSYKDEYVTCGGVSLDSVNIKTLESKVIKNLYFAGEVLDIDAITGGYNLQCAWTTGFISGQLR